jgi:Protein of unknown function (DUF1580)
MVANFDLRKETAIALSDVALYLPKRRGRKIHYSTIFRWVTKGARGRVLNSLLIGGIRYTTIEELGRFMEHSHVALPCTAGSELSAINQALDDAGL